MFGRHSHSAAEVTPVNAVDISSVMAARPNSGTRPISDERGRAEGA